MQAHDGKQAADMLEEAQEKPDLIFLDLNMPVMDGMSFLQVRSSFIKSYKIRVIVITSSDSDEDKKAVNEFDFVEDYLLKPVLEQSLEKYLKKVEASDNPQEASQASGA